MATIYLQTFIKAPLERVFDLARSIDLHKLSTVETNEEAVAGRMSGLIELGETVTWRARHLGVYQKLSVQITEYDRPNYFKDEMLQGAFSYMSHLHSFEVRGEYTLMSDVFEFGSPFGLLGRLFNILFLKAYMRRFLIKRNEMIKSIAEGEEWRSLIVI